MKLHVPANFIGYGTFSLAAMVSLAYVLKQASARALWIGLVAVRPKLLTKPDSGYGPLLQYGSTVLKHRVLFGSGFPMMPVARSLSVWTARCTLA